MGQLSTIEPHTDDGINYTLHGCVVQILTIDDIIQTGDFIRPLYESPMYSQSGGWDTTFKNDKWRGPKWHSVNDDLPAWIGRSYRDLVNFRNEDEHEEYAEMCTHMSDEIVRVIKTKGK